MQKIYVLDTNVLLCDPASILSFADRDVVIPMTVIEELDKKKNEAGELGYHARKVFRVLSDIRNIYRYRISLPMHWTSVPVFLICQRMTT